MLDWERKQKREEREEAESKALTVREYANTKALRPPRRYREGFLAQMDKRSEAFKVLHASYNEITADLGGADSLSHVQRCLVERFVFLEYFLRSLEQKIAAEAGKSKDGEAEKQFARWIQSLNSLTGLAKTVGLERRAKQIRSSLKDYVKSRRKESESGQ